MIIPLTGSGSDQGQWIRNAIDLARDDIERDSGVDISLFYEDSKGGNPQEAITAYKKIIQSNDVVAVVTWGSGVGLALMPLVNADKIVQMGVATATTKYAAPDDFAFRLFPSSSLEGAFNARLVRKLGAKKVAVAYQDNDYGVGEKNAFESDFRDSGGLIVSEEPLEPNGADFRSSILKIKSSDPDLVFLPVYPNEGALFIKQAREAGLNASIFVTSAIGDGVRKAGSAGEGVILSAQSFDMSAVDSPASRFAKSHQDRFGEIPNVYGARAYDALVVMASLLKECGPISPAKSADCLRGKVSEPRSFEGTTGSIRFDKNGDLESADFELMVMRNSSFVRFDGAD